MAVTPKLVPPEMTLVDLCKYLGTSNAWVAKTQRQLNLHREGGGKLRMYTRDEYYIFKKIQMLLILGLSWSKIKEIKQKEEVLRKEIIDELDFRKNEGLEHSQDLDGEQTRQCVVSFLLEKPLKFQANEGQADMIDLRISNVGAVKDDELGGILENAQELVRQANEFMKYLDYLYRVRVKRYSPFFEENT